MRSLLINVLLLLSLSSFAQQEYLLWSDEFNGTGLPDPQKWTFDLGGGGWGNNEIQFYTNVPYNVRQDSGLLIIEAHKAGNSWTSARVITKNLFSFTYGRIVFRAKLPSGSGTWPALWLLGSNFVTAGWPACGEIDVMEHVGKDPGYVHSALHTTSSHGNTVNTYSFFVPNLLNSFHEFQADWTSEKIDFSVDGNLYYTYNPPVKTAANWPFNNPFFFIMNIAMGGNWGSDPQYETNGLKNGIDPALSMARMEIDYVRVYRPGNAGTGDLSPDSKKIIITPNPNNGQFNITGPQGKPVQGIISNTIGMDVYNFQSDENSATIDISFLPKGMYFVSVTSDHDSNTQKIVIE